MDKILIRNNSGNKKEPIFIGPHIVIKDKSPNVLIRVGNKLVEVHKNRTKRYYQN